MCNIHVYVMLHLYVYVMQSQCWRFSTRWMWTWTCTHWCSASRCSTMQWPSFSRSMLCCPLPYHSIYCRDKCLLPIDYVKMNDAMPCHANASKQYPIMRWIRWWWMNDWQTDDLVAMAFCLCTCCCIQSPARTLDRLAFLFVFAELNRMIFLVCYWSPVSLLFSPNLHLYDAEAASKGIWYIYLLYYCIVGRLQYSLCWHKA